jgi:hypothetical protein
MNIEKTINELKHILRNDKEYEATWVANLAMSVWDELPADMKFEDKRKIANGAAGRFLSLLKSNS